MPRQSGGALGGCVDPGWWVFERASAFGRATARVTLPSKRALRAIRTRVAVISMAASASNVWLAFRSMAYFRIVPGLAALSENCFENAFLLPDRQALVSCCIRPRIAAANMFHGEIGSVDLVTVIALPTSDPSPM